MFHFQLVLQPHILDVVDRPVEPGIVEQSLHLRAVISAELAMHLQVLVVALQT